MIDKDAFCNHVLECEKAMYGLAYSIVKNQNDAGDVVGEAIVRAFTNLAALKNESSFQPWILKIVYNTGMEFLRKSRDMLDIDEQRDIPDERSNQDLTRKLALKEAVESLKQPYRTVVVLYYYEDYSAAQIAQITNSNRVLVRQQLSRARRQLKEMLKEDFLYE